MNKKTFYVDKDNKELHKKEILKIGDGHIGRNLFNMIIARYHLIYARAVEEDRVLDCLKHISLYDGLELYRWDIGRGLLDAHNEEKIQPENSELHLEPTALLSYIIDEAKADHQRIKDNKIGTKGRVYILLDFHPWLQDGFQVLERKLKEFSRVSCITTIIVVSPIYRSPIALDKEFTLIDFPYPSAEEIGDALSHLVELDLIQEYPQAVETARKNQEPIINAVRGLTISEALNSWSKSLVRHSDFNVQTILDEKKQIICKTGTLEYRDANVTFDEIGGLENLKEWLLLRKLAFSSDAKKYGLPSPKGFLLLGTPGTGKSLVCSALSATYEMPLLRLDMGAVFASHVGESEKNIRDALNIAAAISPSIIWVDEVEKGLSGVMSSNFTDGGVTSRVFGTLLTWMQEEKNPPVFVACTANNIGGVPPEFLRAGRFDEIFWLDLPNEEQRYEVVSKLLTKKHRNPEDFDINKIVQESDHYSPAEIEKGIDNGMFISYADNRREVKTEDIVNELSKFSSLYNGRQEDIENMRNFALGINGKGGLARLANGVSKIPKVSTKIEITDLEIGKLS